MNAEYLNNVNSSCRSHCIGQEGPACSGGGHCQANDAPDDDGGGEAIWLRPTRKDTIAWVTAFGKIRECEST